MTNLLVIIAARDEADRIGAGIDGLARAFPAAEIWVGDDASTDGTSEAALSDRDALPATVLICDGDLGASAERLRPLVEAVESGNCDLAIAGFRHRIGGGFGIALRFARWAIRSRSGYEAGAPISGQRAMRGEVLRAVLPFAPGYGMEIGMTVDAIRAGYRVAEIELDLEHRATGRTLRGFLHRGRQLRDFMAVWLSRRA
jgi:glycosyltransferase involved in cell wall biosynthesis